MTTFWRRSVHDEIGYLDESLKLAFDYEFWLRLAKRGAPVYLEDRIACFRWYETSKSGANYTSQFEEDARIARRHIDPKNSSVLLRKRFKSAVILATYRAMQKSRKLVPTIFR